MRAAPLPTAVPWLASSGVVQALDYLEGDGTDETHLLRRMMRHAAGRTIHFAAPPVAYTVSGNVPVFPGTTIYGDGVTTLFEQTGDMMPLFDCLDAPACTIHDIKAAYTGPTGGEGASVRGGSAAATHAVVWTNADGGNFHHIISEDFGSPIRIDSWDGTARTARPSGITVDTLVMHRPVFGLLIGGCSSSSFTNISGYNMQNLAGDPPHVIYVTDEANPSTPHMTGLTFADLYGEDCESSAFQFKGMDGGTVTRATAVSCGAIISVHHCADVGFATLSGTEMLSGSAFSGVYTESTTGLTFDGVTLRYAVGQGGTAEAPHRGPVFIGNGLTIDGLDIEFPLAANASASAVWFGNAENDTSDYTVTGASIVNTGDDTTGHAATIRNVPSGFSFTLSTVTGFAGSHNDTGTTAGVIWDP